MIGAARGGPAEQTPLRTSRLLLRPLGDHDADRLVLLAGEREIARMVSTIPHPYARADAQDFIAKAAAGEEGLVYAITTEGALIGCAGLNPQDDGVADLGYWIGKPYWGMGYATEAVGTLLDAALHERWFPAIRAIVFTDNPASIRVLEKLGFEREGEAMRGCMGREGVSPCYVFKLEEAGARAAQG